jgi:hypothetical protein
MISPKAMTFSKMALELRVFRQPVSAHRRNYNALFGHIIRSANRAPSAIRMVPVLIVFTINSSSLRIGQPGVYCRPVLDNFGKKGGGVVSAVFFYARSNSSPGRRRDAVTKARWLSSHSRTLCARTINLLGAVPTKLNG